MFNPKHLLKMAAVGMLATAISPTFAATAGAIDSESIPSADSQWATGVGPDCGWPAMPDGHDQDLFRALCDEVGRSIKLCVVDGGDQNDGLEVNQTTTQPDGGATDYGDATIAEIEDDSDMSSCRPYPDPWATGWGWIRPHDKVIIMVDGMYWGEYLVFP